MTDQLQKIDVARRALIQAKTIPETKKLRDTAEALKRFTKQQNYSLEIQNYANEFLLEAEIKAIKEIADELSLSSATIATYRARIMEKMPMVSEVRVP